MTIYPARKAQIASLLNKKVIVLAKYLDFANVLSKKSAKVLPEQSAVNEHTIKLKKSKQPTYGPIYNLSPLELKILKTYIETNLANGFIQPSKSFACAPILFV